MTSLMTRRTGLSASAKLATAGWLLARVPLQAAEWSPLSDSYALNPLLPWVTTGWNAPSGQIDQSIDQRLRFSLMNWAFSRKDGAILPAGRVELIRRAMPGRVLYEWSMERFFYSVTGTLSCRQDSGETAESWVLRESSQRPGSAARSLTESRGDFAGETVALISLLGSSTATAYWEGKAQPFRFTETGQTVLDGYRLERDVESEKTLPAGWHSLLLTGRGGLPRHLLQDEYGRPLFFTTFGLSYVLEEIANV